MMNMSFGCWSSQPRLGFLKVRDNNGDKVHDARIEFMGHYLCLRVRTRINADRAGPWSLYSVYAPGLEAPTLKAAPVCQSFPMPYTCVQVICETPDRTGIPKDRWQSIIDDCLVKFPEDIRKRVGRREFNNVTGRILTFNLASRDGLTEQLWELKNDFMQVPGVKDYNIPFEQVKPSSS